MGCGLVYANLMFVNLHSGLASVLAPHRLSRLHPGKDGFRLRRQAHRELLQRERPVSMLPYRCVSKWSRAMFPFVNQRPDVPQRGQRYLYRSPLAVVLT